MASNPNNPNPLDEPVRFLEFAVERGPNDAGDSGSILDLDSDPMDVDDDDEDEDGDFYSESDDDEDDDDDEEEEEEDDDDDEGEEDNQMEQSGDDEEEGCDQSGGGDCLICFRSWKSEGRHRICCPPCGHVYGRSCLEKWRKRHGKNTGKCPQCKRKFKQKDIINLYGQLTAVTNADIVAPSEVMSREGNAGREGGRIVERGERTQTQDEQQGWRLTKESWDTMCSRVDTLSTKNEELLTRLHVFEGRIMKIAEGFGVKLDEMLDATGERLGKKVDENFKKLFEFCKNPSDTSNNPFDIPSPNVGVAPPLEANLEKILETMEERIGKKMYENFKKGFEAYGIQFGSPSPKFGPTPSSSTPEDTAS